MEINKFLHSIHGVIKGVDAAKQFYKDRFSPEFSVFDFIRPDERRLSVVFAWMLNPNGSHGQSTKFLDAFIDQLALPFRWDQETLAAATVKTEFSTHDKGRIDVLVYAMSGAIAIENKPWAGDSDDQVCKYLHDLDKRFDDKFCLLYLSGHGQDPSDESLSQKEKESRTNKKQFCVIGYEGLIPWLEKCRSLCKSARVSEFLDDFTRYINATFLGIQDMTSHEQIIDNVLESRELAAAFQVANAVPEIRARLLQRLKDQICQRAELQWQLVWEIENRMPYFGFRYAKTDHYYFCLQFDKNWDGLIWGITKENASDADLEQVREALNRIGRGTREPWWVWKIQAASSDEICNIEPNWGVNEKPWLAILDGGTLADSIVKAAKDVQAALSEAGLLGALR